MAINKFNDFATTQAYSESVSLPQGGYICKIIGAKVENGNYGQYVKIAFDIAEGEYKDFYKKRFDSNTSEDKKWSGVLLLNVPADDESEKDGWTKRKFKTFTDALEDSNSGYHFDWDETKFKDKLIGLVTRREAWEHDGRTDWTNKPFAAYSVKSIRDGKFSYPKDKGARGGSSAPVADSNGFMNIADGTMEEIPF